MSAVNISIIVLTIGSGSFQLGYEIQGPAYDVAFEKARHLYPKVFQSLEIARHYVPGQFTCEGASGESIVALADSLHQRRLARRAFNDFTIVISPGCNYESILLGDYLREEDITLVSSISSGSIFDNKSRFPTLLPWSPTAFVNHLSTLISFMKMNRWSRLNAACDVNKGSDLGQTTEISCGMFRQAASNRLLELNIVILYFNSSDPATMEPVLLRTLDHSAITVFASSTEAYRQLLEKVSQLGMATGEFVFILLPLSMFTQTEELQWKSTEVSANLRQGASYAFFLAYDPIKWDSIREDVDTMVNLSSSQYNFTVPHRYQRNLLQIAAYESALMLSEVLNSSYDRLNTLTGREFAKHFYSKTFHLPSRNVTLSRTGSRVCDFFIRQFQPDSGTFQTIWRFDGETLRLARSKDYADVMWPGATFPPPDVPACGLRHELCATSGTSTVALSLSLTVLGAIIIVALVAAWWIYTRRYRFSATWWIVTL